MDSRPIRLAALLSALTLTLVGLTGCDTATDPAATDGVIEGITEGVTVTAPADTEGLPLPVRACVDGIRLATKAYASTTSPAGRYLAEKATDAGLKGASAVADYVANGKPGVAADIREAVERLRNRQTLSEAADMGIDALELRQAKTVHSLNVLSGLCVKAGAPS